MNNFLVLWLFLAMYTKITLIHIIYLKSFPSYLVWDLFLPLIYNDIYNDKCYMYLLHMQFGAFDTSFIFRTFDIFK